MTKILISITAFDDRTLMCWSSSVDGQDSPIQWRGRVDAKPWADMFSSLLDTDAVRVCVTDRRNAGKFNSPKYLDETRSHMAAKGGR